MPGDSFHDVRISLSLKNLMSRPPKIPSRNKPIAAPAKGQSGQAAIIALLQQALALHQQGQFAQGQALYEQVLAKDPKNFDALHLLGVLALQTQNPAAAADLIGQAIKVNPNHAAAYSNRGNALKSLKRLDEAVASYDKAIRLKPDYAEAHSNRGNALLDLKRLDEAIVSYDRAIKLKLDYAEAYSNRGNAFLELKLYEEAIASYDQAIKLKPDHAEAYYNRGVTLFELRRLEQAVASYDLAITARPNYAEAYCNRGNALKELEQTEQAVASYDQALRIRPDYAQAYSNRGNALKALKRLDGALVDYDKAISIEPDYADAYYNRGVALAELGQLDQAVESYEQAIRFKADYVEAHTNLGNTLLQLRRLENVLASYDQAISIKPDYAEAQWNKSLYLLLTGDLARGFELYEWGRKLAQRGASNQFSQPFWLGTESLAGKTILLQVEQGLGDCIQFCRYAKLVSALGARVLLETPAALARLFEGLEGVSELLQVGQVRPHFDYYTSLLSLPLAFKTTLATVPNSIPYLTTTPEKQKLWGERLGAKTKPRIGLVWSGSTGHKNDHNRSFRLDALTQYLTDRFEYVCLQKELREVDRAVLEKSEIKYFGAELNDFTDTAALCELMDVVISVDTSVAHLAGALGKPTWVLLPYVPDWRWLLNRVDSPWYPSVKLYRQEADRDWGPVLERLAEDLLKSAE